MYCTKCGSKISDESVFCNVCGNRISSEQTGKSDALKKNNTTSVQEHEKSNDPEKKPRKGKTWVAVLVAVALIAVSGIAVCTVLYLKGTLNAEMFGFVQNEDTSHVESSVSEEASDTQAADITKQSATETETSTPRKPGEVVMGATDESTADDDESGDSDKTDPIIWDPFEGIAIQVEGVSPGASVSIKDKPDPPKGVTVNYSFDKDGEISLGDVITISADCELNGSAKDDYSITNTQMEITIEDVPFYPYQLEDIPDTALDTMKEKTFSYVSDSLESLKIAYKEYPGRGTAILHKSSGEYSFDLDTILLDKIYVCTRKNGIGNRVYFVYSVNVDVDGEETQKTYCAAYYDDVVIDGDEMSSPGYTRMKFLNVSTFWIDDENEFYDQYISSEKKNYEFNEYTDLEPADETDGSEEQ